MFFFLEHVALLKEEKKEVVECVWEGFDDFAIDVDWNGCFSFG